MAFRVADRVFCRQRVPLRPGEGLSSGTEGDEGLRDVL
jgi:hypothetical protein